MENRRAFCVNACRVSLGAALWPCVVQAADDLPTVTGDASGNTVRVVLTGTPLAALPSYARVVSYAGAFLVSRFSDQDLEVFSAICSHESCLITEGDRETFVCPCHGSTFDHHGAVLVGPAELPLSRCAATLADDVLTITVT